MVYWAAVGRLLLLGSYTSRYLLFVFRKLVRFTAYKLLFFLFYPLVCDIAHLLLLLLFVISRLIPCIPHQLVLFVFGHFDLCAGYCSSIGYCFPYSSLGSFRCSLLSFMCLSLLVLLRCHRVFVLFVFRHYCVAHHLLLFVYRSLVDCDAHQLQLFVYCRLVLCVSKRLMIFYVKICLLKKKTT